MDKILVAYTTWAGATHEIAEEIAKTIRKNNVEVVISPANDVNSITEYKAIILGSSIHAGQTNKKFNQFLKRFQTELQTKKLAVFVVCANMIEDCPKNRKETADWLNTTLKKYPDIKPCSTGLFSGALITEGEDFRKLNFMFRKMLLSMKDTYIKEHGRTDFRNWPLIREWAETTIKEIEAN